MTMLNFKVDENHPSLPGHFPDSPIVPGVVILQHVFAAFSKAHHKLTIQEILNVKFRKPLSLNIESEITFKEIQTQQFQFQVKQHDQLIASGSLMTESSL